MEYTWHDGPWLDIFDEQIELVRSDIRRANAEDKLVVYLSCPISSRGGGYSGTNVDIAKHIERVLLERWGDAFWILNPAQYQLESKAGTGLMEMHARRLKIDLAKLRGYEDPFGGDYMRMWTTLLVANDERVGALKVAAELKDTGQFFDAFYFVGPRDVHSFFVRPEETLTAGVQSYFSRKFATDPDFRDQYSIAGICWHKRKQGEALHSAEQDGRDEWKLMRIEFLRYYVLRASANFSLGSHDEWVIFRELNRRRRAATADPSQFMVDGDVGVQIPGFFDGGQLDPGSTEASLSKGYAWGSG
ncbi:MAG TPA: hypothetical protein VEI82_13720 [Myxococcota bacterium]|nr:hypothetical protein [Myxococcota bacterium]